MSEFPILLEGPLSRRTIAKHEQLVEGRRYRVWLRIAELRKGTVCVWVGGNRTAFFAAPGDHVVEIAAGDRHDVMVQGLDAVATIDGVAVTQVTG
jgi:hypothetical protein